MLNTVDRCRGCFVGLFCGDALGQLVEFAAPGTFEPITGYRAGGPHNLEKGQFTDDGSMALALADSLKHGWDLNDQAERYCQWLEEGKYSVNGWCFDIGATTRQALERFMECKDATKSGLTEPSASGNGGIMRIAPVAIRYHNFEEHPKGTMLSYSWESLVPMLYSLGSQSSSVTHASEMCNTLLANEGL